ncbi:MAG: YbaY family lipoprotein, partial [Kiritimatiellae bacterium]|nr:YbaY family lipoprotein [Kiritimatiellia bacterium]
PWRGGEDFRRPAVEEPRTVTVGGSVTCPERITLLPVYELRIRLADLRTGASICEKTETGLTGFPVFFELEYDPADVRQGSVAGLSAELLSGGEPLLATDTRTSVVAGKNVAGANLVLVRSR